MNKNKNFPLNPRKLYSIMISVLLLMSVIATACNIPVNEPIETQELVDKDARIYRMYYDSSADAADSELQIRYFIGQLRMADLEAIFGDLDDLPTDDNGNHVGGPLLEDGIVWSLVTSPSQQASNLVTSDLDGMTSSALDIDGDRNADIVDIQLGDGRRISFATEELGMGIFEAWLQGHNPLCDSSMLQDLGLEGFRCGDEAGGGGEEGSGGGAGGPSVGIGYVDPLDQLCADYNNSPSFGMNRGFGGLPPDRRLRFGYDVTYTGGGEEHVITAIWEDSNGEWVGTTKIFYQYDDEGELVRTITETLLPDGRGQRTIETPGRRNADGSVTLPNRTREPFVARPNSNGDYAESQSEPPTPGTTTSSGDTSGGSSSESPPDEDPPPPPEDTNPGPEGDDSSIADLCARRENVTSGVEQAAATDPTAFQVSCNDLVGAPAGGDCSIFEWARPEDFQGALEPSGNDDGCGEFEERSQGGDCEPSNVMEILRGRTAMIASANLQGIALSPPILTNPNPVEAAEARQEVSDSNVDPDEEFATVTPAASSHGEISELTLCNTGPGPEFETISSLKTGVVVKILGIGAKKGWLITDHPDYPGVSCWVAESKVIPNPDFDPTLYPVFPIPENNPDSNNNNPSETADDCQDPYYYSPNTGKCELFE